MLSSILIVTGQSGSGKSTAIRTLEDHGYYCVDHIPLQLVEPLIETLGRQGHVERLALVIDIRERDFGDTPALVERLRRGPLSVRIVFLEAQEDALLRRYSETRRTHPLDLGSGLRYAIKEERALLTPLRELADETLDTSGMTPHALRASILERVIDASADDTLRLAFLSFGFKHGLPLEADLIFDVRFLRNPYFEPSLRPHTGRHPSVRDYVLSTPEAQEFVDRTESLLQFLVPQYQREGKRYLTIAFGCTGGQHRSVVIAAELCRRFSTSTSTPDLRHRDATEGGK